MAQILRTQVRIEKVSGITADAIVNTFHWILEDDTRAAAVTAAGNILTRLETFYQAVDNYMPPLLVATTPSVKTYTLMDPEPRVPLLVGNITITPSGTSALPSEVAMCLSYRGDLASGVNPARRKGRIFLGPLGTNAIDSTVVAGEVRPLPAFTGALRAAGQVLAGVTVGLPTWCVWSPTALTAAPVTFVSTDNAFDTQRRRGAAPTFRTEVPG